MHMSGYNTRLLAFHEVTSPFGISKRCYMQHVESSILYINRFREKSGTSNYQMQKQKTYPFKGTKKNRAGYYLSSQILLGDDIQVRKREYPDTYICPHSYSCKLAIMWIFTNWVYVEARDLIFQLCMLNFSQNSITNL